MLSYDDKHPKGTKYRPDELKFHRDGWTSKINAARPADYCDEHRKLDQGLFLRILRRLPWNGSIGFISTNNFAGFSFDCRALLDLHELAACNDDPSWEFIDPTLEIARANLAHHVSRFLGLIGMNTFPTDNPDRNSVPEEWERERPEHFFQVVDEIHEAASRCVDSYKTLLREGRRRLAIESPADEEPTSKPKT